MRIDRQEADAFFAAQTKKRPLPQAQSQGLDQRLLAQAEIATANLTGDPAWDVFLQRVQALIDSEREILTAMAQALAMPNLSSEQILQGQRQMLAANTRIEAWETVLRLPGEILDAARAQTAQPQPATD